MTEMEYSNVMYRIALVVLPLVLAVSAHEAAHGFVADKLGDSTARLLGRVTLNPLPHIDLFGTVIFPLLLILTNTGVIFAYAKPVPVQYSNLRNLLQDMVLVSFAGPLTNLSLALLSGILVRVLLLLMPEVAYYATAGGNLLEQGGGVVSVLVPVYLVLEQSVLINVVLAVFNCIPIPPLDGGHMLMGMVSGRAAALLQRIEPYGFFIILGLVIVDPFGLWSRSVSIVMMELIRLCMFL